MEGFWALIMKEVSNKDKLFYFERNFFTLDGLRMLETESEVGWDTALKIDKAVREPLPSHRHGFGC